MQQNNGMNIKYYNNKKCKLTPENMFYLKEQLQIKVVFLHLKHLYTLRYIRTHILVIETQRLHCWAKYVNNKGELTQLAWKTDSLFILNT